MSQTFSPRSACRILSAVIFALTLISHAAAVTETVLHQFVSQSHGAFPESLVADAEGNMFGMTQDGGTYGFGSVFELSKNSSGNWTQTVIYSFTGLADGNNYFPYTNENSLIFDKAGNLYGTTPQGGTRGGVGLGVVFKLSPGTNGNWNFSVLYSFKGGKTDGDVPSGPLAFDAQGDLYGTTTFGGNQSSNSCQATCRVVFRLSPSASGWTEKIVHLFTSVNEGANRSNGCGVVFRLSPNSNGSWTQATLYSFTCGADGGGPEGALVLDAAGNLYGTTPIGGTGSACGYGCGVVFELAPSSTVPWNETVIYDFPSSSTGAYPESTLTFDKAGNLYGTTNGGGDAPSQFCDQGCGTVFELTPSSSGWQEKTLYNFTGPLADGAQPEAGVILDSSGNIYGTTRVGGIDGYDYQYGGTVYKIVPSNRCKARRDFFPISGRERLRSRLEPLNSSTKALEWRWQSLREIGIAGNQCGFVFQG